MITPYRKKGKKMDTLNIMTYDVYIKSLDTIKIDPNKKQIINTINPHSYVIANKDIHFREALRGADILLPDGSGIVIAAKNNHRLTIPRITGSDLHAHLLGLLEAEGGSCFYMGSSVDTLAKIKERIQKERPTIKVGFYSPPYKDHFSQEENQEILEAIGAFKPDVLFIGMTAPKQEKWLHDHKVKLDVKITASVGAVFDFYAGNIQRSSQFWIDRNLEWFPRLIQEPHRLWRRNLISTPLFLTDMMLYKWKIKK
jgi:N-acetylglucosaminyldiphosphoundecaprenol N-acetyl-beta-D-mannosaminyltransferase